jgi:hypothetical protein
MYSLTMHMYSMSVSPTPTAHISGFNKGANASGIIYGLPRQIGGVDPKKSAKVSNSVY